jgi:hypothetical protein
MEGQDQNRPSLRPTMHRTRATTCYRAEDAGISNFIFAAESLKRQHWPVRRRIKGRDVEYPVLKKLNRHRSRLRSIFADHHQLSFFIRDSGISSQRCEDAAVTPVADLQ